jgi:hypothetical protein
LHPLGTRHANICAKPFHAAKTYKSKGQYLTFSLITPFGVTLLGLSSPRALGAFFAGLAATFFATDTQRIWQPFCALPLITATVTLLPEPILPALTALHLLNPWAGKGE